MSSTRKPVLLVIRDGWGKNPHTEQNATNAVFLAKKACDDALQAKYPHTLVSASGLDVGLPEGQMGNSEVGHENIGAGRIVDQELVRLNKLFSEKQLATNPVWHAVVARVKASPTAKLHVMGIVSDGGVHGMLEHLYGILRQAKEDGLRKDQVFIHGFTDGRDTPPSGGLGYIKQVEAQCAAIGQQRAHELSSGEARTLHQTRRRQSGGGHAFELADFRGEIDRAVFGAGIHGLSLPLASCRHAAGRVGFS